MWFDVVLSPWCRSLLPIKRCELAVYESEERVDAVGSCAVWVCPVGVLLGRVPVHALRGGGGAPGRGIKASMDTGSS